MPIRSTLHDNARPQTAPLIQEKSDQIHWNTLKEELEGHYFDDDAGVETFVRNWLQTRPDSFFDDRRNYIEK